MRPSPPGRRTGLGTRAEPVGWYSRRGKRAFDVAFALALSVVVVPIVGLLAIVVLLRMGRPVFFRQQRIGRDGVPFDILKFRTMCREADQIEVSDDVRKSDVDPRVTPFGRFLRRWSLDELPQLWNVLVGQMSLVGPRPELVGRAVRSGIVDHPRHAVRPGITCLWQLSTARNRPIHEGLAYDEAYLENVSFRNDLRIILRTVFGMVRLRGR